MHSILFPWQGWNGNAVPCRAAEAYKTTELLTAIVSGGEGYKIVKKITLVCFIMVIVILIMSGSTFAPYSIISYFKTNIVDSICDLQIYEEDNYKIENSNDEVDYEIENLNDEIEYQEIEIIFYYVDEYQSFDLSQGQKNIVKRARQMTEIEWTPLRSIRSWSEHPNFEAGNTYRGIPYGRPIYHTPLNFSFEEFIDAINDENSYMYTRYSTRDSIAPFYSTDCSAFVSYAWGASRHWTWEFPQIADNVGNNLQDIEVGDILNNPHIHVVLITDIVKESDEIVSIEISEAFGKISRRIWFGEEHERPLYQINIRYLNNGYNILRFRERDYVMYEHSCLISINHYICCY